MSQQKFGGLLPPFSAIQHDDQAGKVWVVTILTIVYVVISALVRGFIKWGLYRADDYLLVVATFLCLAQSGSIIYALGHGLSKFNSITAETEWITSGRSFIASEILTILGLCLTKCSVVLLMHRLFSSNTGWGFWLRIATISLSTLWGISAMIAIPTGCNADTVLTRKGITECPGQVDRWLAITITDIATDVLICVLPVALTWHLHMPLKKKSQVVVAFAFRLPVIIFSTIHFIHLEQFPMTAEPLYSVTDVVVQQQCMLLWSLVSATIPNMKAFIQSFSMDFGMGLGLNTIQKNSSYPMNNLTIGSAHTRHGRETNDSRVDGDGGISSGLRPDPYQHKSVILHHTAGDTVSIGSHGSQDLIIRKVVDWHVHSEPST